MIKVDEPVRPLAMVGILSTGILCGALLGAITNAVNGFVSPGYFIVIMHWHGVDDVWRASIAQGIFEGILFGAGFSLIFTVGVGLMTQASVSYPFAARHLVGIFAGTLACWIFGGTAAVYLASLSPAFYRATFIGVPDEFGAMLAYAWVGGSIWGIELGGLISVVVGLVILRANWLKRRSVMS